MDIGKKCTDPNFEFQIIRDIAATVMQGKELELSPESRRHVEECERCRECLPIWAKNGRASYEDKQYDKIIHEAEQGNPEIVKRTTREGLAFFKPHDKGSTSGVVVIVDPEHRSAIRSIYTDMSLGEFQAL